MGFSNDCVLNIHSVDGAYFCPVCRTLVYPNEALQTPCTHLYCKQCLVHIAKSTQACPYDGHLVTESNSKPLVETNKILAETIGKIAVCCYYHRSGCMWQGTLSECTVHHLGCAFGNSLVICTKCGIQILHREAEEHAQICNVNGYPQTYPYSNAVQGHDQQQMQDSQFQQSHQQMHLPQPCVGHPYPQPQIQSYPEGQTQVYPQMYPFSHGVEGQGQQQMQVPQFQQSHPQTYDPQLPLQPYPEGQTRNQQILQAPSQQQVQPSTGSIPPGRVPASLLQVQQPMAQQYVQVPLVSAGYTTGPVQAQLHHAGPFAQSEACPPQQMQHPPSLGHVQTQQEIRAAHDLMPCSFQSCKGRPATLNESQSSVTTACGAIHAWPPQFGSSLHQNDVNMVNQSQSLNNSNGPGAYLNDIKPKNRPSDHFQCPLPYQSGSFSFYPQYHLGGSSAPCSARQSHAIAPPYGPPRIVSSSPPVPFYELVRAPIWKRADAFSVEPAQHHLDQSTKSTCPHQGKSGFCQSCLTCLGFPSADPFYADGSDSFDNSRKGAGWCHICKVDYESLHGLKLHAQTCEHKWIATELVKDIKHKYSRLAKMPNASYGLGEASKQ